MAEEVQSGTSTTDSGILGVHSAASAAAVAHSHSAPAAAHPAPIAPAEPKPLAAPAKPDRGGFVWGTGRRKTAVARVRIKPGSGKFLVNGREYEKFFNELRDRMNVTSPLKVTNTSASIDVYVNVNGGGCTGQAGAVLLGLARALKRYDPALEPILRSNDLLTRDSRKVERKKYGQSGARKRFQFSKR